MELTQIKRETAAIIDWTPDTVSLAEEAEALLGYGRLKQEQATETKPLARVLADLGIDVLNSADVEQYKVEHMKEVAHKKFEEWFSSTRETGAFYCPSWGLSDIKEYREPIPEFVINKAVQIKKAFPEAEIMIEYLNENPDPFLVVRIMEEKQYDWGKYKTPVESYYVEVWAEPKFEGRARSHR